MTRLSNLASENPQHSHQKSFFFFLTISARLSPTIAEEASEALEIELPREKFADWQEINIHDKLCRIVGMVSGRLFIGPEACRSEEYLDAAINYTIDVMQAVHAASSLRPWLRPFLAHRLPEVKKLNRRIEEADAFLRPLVERRSKMHNDKAASEDVPEDFLQWLLESGDSTSNFAKVQLSLTFAAIHTTVLTTTNACVPSFGWLSHSKARDFTVTQSRHLPLYLIMPLSLR